MSSISPHTPPNPIWYGQIPNAPERSRREFDLDSPAARRPRHEHTPVREENVARFADLFAAHVGAAQQQVEFREQALEHAVNLRTRFQQAMLEIMGDQEEDSSNSESLVESLARELTFQESDDQPLSSENNRSRSSSSGSFHLFSDSEAHYSDFDSEGSNESLGN